MANQRIFKYLDLSLKSFVIIGPELLRLCSLLLANKLGKPLLFFILLDVFNYLKGRLLLHFIINNNVYNFKIIRYDPYFIYRSYLCQDISCSH